MKRWMIWVAGLAAFVVVAVLAAPKLLETRVVKDRVTAQLSDVLGVPVRLAGSGKVSLWPYLGVSFSDVRLEGEAGEDAIVTIDRLDARLRLLAALFGDARLSELTLVRPVLRFGPGGVAALKDGALGAWWAGDAEAPISLGQLTIEDGIALVPGAGEQARVTGLAGTIDWPRTDRAFDLDVTGIWNGERVALTARLDDPGALRDARDSGLTLDLAASPIGLRYDGTLARPLGDERRLKGEARLSFQSAERLTQWLGLPASALTILGATEISGQLDANGTRAELAEAAVTSSQRNGRGRLAAKWGTTDAPRLSGTLAFDDLALPDWLGRDEHRVAALIAEPAPLSAFDIDMRLSAPRATSGAIELSNFAGALLVQDGRASFDIAQAGSAAGEVTGSLRLHGSGAKPVVTVGLSLAGGDVAGFSQLWSDEAAPSPIALSGPGRVSLNLNMAGHSRAEMLRVLNGDASVELAAGQIDGVDMAALLQSGVAGETAILDTGGATAFERATFDLFLANGIALLREGKITSPDLAVLLSGRADLTRGSLALRGQVEGQADSKMPVAFFVGGTGSSPLIVPLPGRRFETELAAPEPAPAPPVASQ